MEHQSKKWKSLEDECDADELEDTYARALDLKQEADSLNEHALSLSGGPAREQERREALGVYRKATSIIKPVLGQPPSQRGAQFLVDCMLCEYFIRFDLQDINGCEDLLRQIAELDAENPFAALSRARLAHLQNDRAEGDRWITKAHKFAKNRQDEEALSAIAEYAAMLYPDQAKAALAKQGIEFHTEQSKQRSTRSGAWIVYAVVIVGIAMIVRSCW